MSTAYQVGPRRTDRSQPCANRNGIWPPIYTRHWTPHPARSLGKTAQGEWQRCVQDAVAGGELHRTTGSVLLALCRFSDDRLDDVWPAQVTVAQRLALAASTVCHHVTLARRAGWLVVQHRNRIDHGQRLAMTNVTRFQLPARWVEQLETQRQQRAERRHQERAARPGRTTPRHTPTPAAGEDGRARTWTPAMHAAGFGAAQARVAPDFETGRRVLEDEFAGAPGDYEAAYEQYAATWRTVRQNE